MALCVLAAAGCGGPQRGAQRGFDAGAEPDDGGASDSGPAEDAPDSGSSSTMSGKPSCSELECDANASCDDSSSTPLCKCNAGYEGDGKSCTDIDECANDNGGCDAHATCVNRPGGYRCLCDETFTGDGKTCTGANECADASLDTCDPNASCSDADVGFGCACKAGFSGDGFGCADVNECANASDHSCADHASCDNTFGGYDCTCDPGFSGDGKTACQGLCEAHACSGDTLCRITQSDSTNTALTAATCSTDTCAIGYVGDGTNCTAVADGECTQCDGKDGDDVPGAACTGTPGAGSCACAPGYSGTFPDCTDIDECTANPTICGDAASNRCTNLPGGYICDCQPGYEKDSTGTCVNKNECASTPGPCHPNATCTDKTPAENPKGYECACKPGFTGDGTVCADIDECTKGTDNCLEDGTARCVNTPGSFECRCKRGFSGDGVTKCENIDECKDPDLNNCDANAKCTDQVPTADNPLGYDCTCKPGLGGDGTTCADVDECKNALLNDCTGHSTCVNDPGGYHCACQAPFAGDGSACYCDLSGYWAMRQDVDTSWDNRDVLGVTFIKAGQVHTTNWELHKYTYDGNVIKTQKKGCGGQGDPEFVSPPFAETYSSYVPNSVYDGLALEKGVDIPQPGILPGDMFTTPDEAAIGGIDLGPDPETAPWPSDYAAVNPVGSTAKPAWTDLDGDGEPGITVWPHLPSEPTTAGSHFSYLPVAFTTDNQGNLVITERAGCVSVATRVITKLDVDVDTCTHITGSVVNVKTEGRVQGCSLLSDENAWGHDFSCNADDWAAATACGADEIMVLDDQDQSQTSTATFELVKIGELSDKVDCNDVRTSLPAVAP